MWSLAGSSGALPWKGVEENTCGGGKGNAESALESENLMDGCDHMEDADVSSLCNGSRKSG